MKYVFFSPQNIQYNAGTTLFNRSNSVVWYINPKNFKLTKRCHYRKLFLGGPPPQKKHTEYSAHFHHYDSNNCPLHSGETTNYQPALSAVIKRQQKLQLLEVLSVALPDRIDPQRHTDVSVHQKIICRLLKQKWPAMIQPKSSSFWRTIHLDHLRVQPLHQLRSLISPLCHELILKSPKTSLISRRGKKTPKHLCAVLNCSLIHSS